LGGISQTQKGDAGANMIEVGGKVIGPGHPLFIAVEVGSTCHGDLATAKKLADAAKECGADAIKWQMINPDALMADRSVMYPYEWAGGTHSENMYEMFRGLTFTLIEWGNLTDYCDSIGIPWYTSVDNLPDMETAEGLGCPMYKLSSWDARNFPLIRRMAATKKPIQIDLGPVIEAEISTILSTSGLGRESVILVHCTHAKDKHEFNMKAISYLVDRFGLPIGWSSEGRDWIPDFVAIGQGACLIEKRMTLNNRHKGHHHMKALEPHEFEAWVKMVRSADAMMGEYEVKPSLEDLRQKSLWFTSIVAAEDINQGDRITDKMLCAKRPGHGISPLYTDRFVDKIAARNIRKDEVIGWQDVS